MELIDQTKQLMKQALEHLEKELRGIRTGRANAGILDTVVVEVYDTKMRIKDLATVTTPEPRQIIITPFDPGTTNTIAKAIEKSNIGLNPSPEGNLIRINIPPMDESMRKQMVKLCNEEKEHCKVSIRNVRKESNDEVKRLKAASEITEDEQKKLEMKIQDLTDTFCQKADEITATKEKEVMTI